MIRQIRQWAAVRRFLGVAMLAAAAWLASWPAAGAGPQTAPLEVVASFSILGDMVAEIGGDHIRLTTIVGSDGDVHSFEPRPSDARALARAQLLVVNGLNFEGWLPRLAASSGFQGVTVVASQGVEPRLLGEAEHTHHADHPHHDDVSDSVEVDPHAWQSLGNGMIYARNIASALIKADPAHAKDYRERAERYVSDMMKLDRELRHALAAIPEERRKVVTSHDSFGYFARDYGVHFISVLGISSDAEPSAKELAALIKQVKREQSAAVFLENVTSSKLIRQLARETGAKVGGTLYSDSLAEPDQPAGTYLGMLEWNAGQLIYALKPASPDTR